jgi:hypothetical protein
MWAQRESRRDRGNSTALSDRSFHDRNCVQKLSQLGVRYADLSAPDKQHEIDVRLLERVAAHIRPPFRSPPRLPIFDRRHRSVDPLPVV